ncbi:MAG: hypothetical protein OSJ72_15150 [Lachnospiraceae bacterium]|nr:hypothetical protein [Lachnospiraceae bacterium]
MKEKLEGTIAVIFLILLALFLAMALTAECGGVMDPIRQQIKDESMIT